MNKYKSAFDEAEEIFRSKIKVPKLYLYAFYSTQKLEVYLRWILSNFIEKVQGKLKDSEISFKPRVDDDWTAREYLNRIKIYLSIAENRNFYKILNNAIDRRNEFIHNCFKVKSEKGIGINLDTNAFHLNKDSLDKLQKWLQASSEAETVILTLLARLLRIR